MDVKHHVYLLTYLLTKGNSELRSCVKVEVAALGSRASVPTSPYCLCGRKAMSEVEVVRNCFVETPRELGVTR